MQLTDHTLTIGDYTETIPTLAVDATVHAWSVPTTYRESGYFVSVQRAGDPMEAPACDGREVEYLGSAELAADEEAKTAAELDGIKAAACERINTKRDTIEYGVFTDSHGVRYDVDSRGREKMTGLTAMLGATGIALPAGFTWTDADNVERQYDAETFLALTTEITNWTANVHGVAVSAKAAIRADAVTTLEQVAAIEAGVEWP